MRSLLKLSLQFTNCRQHGGTILQSDSVACSLSRFVVKVTVLKPLFLHLHCCEDHICAVIPSRKAYTKLQCQPNYLQNSVLAVSVSLEILITVTTHMVMQLIMLFLPLTFPILYLADLSVSLILIPHLRWSIIMTQCFQLFLSLADITQKYFLRIISQFSFQYLHTAQQDLSS